jgi:hypothetical protein
MPSGKDLSKRLLRGCRPVELKKKELLPITLGVWILAHQTIGAVAR